MKGTQPVRMVQSCSQRTHGEVECLETCRTMQWGEKKDSHTFAHQCCTSYETANSQPVNKNIVKELAACKELSYHIQIGSDRSGCV